MFNRGGDDMTAVRLLGFAYAANGQVVGLCAAGGEDDFVGARIDQGSDLAPGFIDCGARLLPELMNARCVAELVTQKRQHRVEYPSVDWGGGAVIQVNSHKRVVGSR